MRIAIIHPPGSILDADTAQAVARADMVPVGVCRDHELTDLTGFSGFILVGNEGSDMAMDLGSAFLDVIKSQSELGKPIMGIGQGAKILVDSGLVPGIADHGVGITLVGDSAKDNLPDSLSIRLTEDYQYNAYTGCLSYRNILEVPVTYMPMRFIIPPGLLAEMRIQGLNLFQYCNQAGKILDEFPINPNASVENIAAVSNKAGNVLAIAPHIECTPNGDAIFQSMRAYIAKGHVERVAPLHYLPR